MKNYKSMDDELERFKSTIGIEVVAASMGYVRDKAKSSAASKTLRLEGDTVIVACAPDGHDVYFSRHDPSDNGSVIDFVKNRVAPHNLGGARKYLRDWLPGAARPAAMREFPERPIPVSRDLLAVMAEWERLAPYKGSYLRDRGLHDDIVRGFGVRQDVRGNACFAHRGAVDERSVTGWEKKNRGFTGFTTGGQRGVMMARLDHEPVTRIVVCEASIDAMSWAQLHGRPAGIAYVSIGGEPSPEQIEMLRQVLARNADAAILAATDHDEGGERLAGKISSVAPEGAAIERARPGKPGQDWNDVLRALRAVPAAADERAATPTEHQ